MGPGNSKLAGCKFQWGFAAKGPHFTLLLKVKLIHSIFLGGFFGHTLQNFLLKCWVHARVACRLLDS